MHRIQRRSFLRISLLWLGTALVGLFTGSSLISRDALARLKQKTTQQLKKVLQQSTPQNVIRVLKTSTLPPEDKLAVCALRQLGPAEVRQSLDRLKDIGLTTELDAGHNCGIDCGGTCGSDCGSDCGGACGSQCDGPGASATGAFCGGGCRVQAGAIGVVDPTGSLGINFMRINMQRLQQSVKQAMSFTR